MANRAKHVFGSLENIDAALQNGTIDQYDTFFLKDKNGKPYIGWIDEDRNKVIVENSAMSQVPQADWNQNDETAKDYIKNKPFGETTVMGDTLTWDGNTEGLEDYNNDSYGPLCKISNVAPTLEQLKNGVKVVVKTITGEVYDTNIISFDELYYYDDSKCMNFDGGEIQLEEYRWSYEYDGVQYEGVREKGVYFFADKEFGTYTAELQIPDFNGFERTEIKKIPAEYLPDGVPYDTRKTEAKKYTWDGHLDGKEYVYAEDRGKYLVKVSDDVESILSAKEVHMELFDNDTHEHYTSFDIESEFGWTDNGEGLLTVNADYDWMVVVATKDSELEGVLLKKGVYLLKQENYGYITNVTFEVNSGTFRPSSSLIIEFDFSTRTPVYDDAILNLPPHEFLHSVCVFCKNFTDGETSDQYLPIQCVYLLEGRYMLSTVLLDVFIDPINKTIEFD